MSIMKDRERWISVKERPPERNGEYVCWMEEPVHGRRLALCLWVKGGWVSVNGATYPDMPQPLYWRDIAPPAGWERGGRIKQLEAEVKKCREKLDHAEITIDQMGQRMARQDEIIMQAGLCPYCGSTEHEYTGESAGGSMTTERGQLIEGEEHEVRCVECERKWWEKG